MVIGPFQWTRIVKRGLAIQGDIKIHDGLADLLESEIQEGEDPDAELETESYYYHPEAYPKDEDWNQKFQDL